MANVAGEAGNVPDETDDTARGALIDAWRSWADRLEALPTEAWDAPTRCPGWKVRDLAAHLAPPPPVMQQLLHAVLDQPAACADPAALLRTMNQPGGAAHELAGEVAQRATDAGASATPEELIANFRGSADVVAGSPLADGDVVPHPVAGSVTVGVLTSIALMEATVHLLDLIDAIGGPPPSTAALVLSRDLLARVADPVTLLEAMAGRRSATDALPVIR